MKAVRLSELDYTFRPFSNRRVSFHYGHPNSSYIVTLIYHDLKKFSKHFFGVMSVPVA